MNRKLFISLLSILEMGSTALVVAKGFSELWVQNTESVRIRILLQMMSKEGYKGEERQNKRCGVVDGLIGPLPCKIICLLQSVRFLCFSPLLS